MTKEIELFRLRLILLKKISIEFRSRGSVLGKRLASLGNVRLLYRSCYLR